MSPPPQLPGVLGHLAPLLNQHGYLAVGGLVLLEDFGLPVPGETILVAAAVYAGAARLNVVAVGLVALAAAIIGDNIGFAIGHFGGRRLALRYGRYVFLTKDRLDRAQDLIGRHGGKIVIVARFIEGLRQLNGVITGIAGMRWAAFVAFNALGATLWVGAWLTVGYVSGRHIDTIYRIGSRYELYFGIAVAALILAAITRHLLRRRRADRAGQR